MQTLERARQQKASILPGALVAVAVGVVAIAFGQMFPVVGGPVTAVILGVAITVVIGKRANLAPGLKFVGSRFLQVAVVLLGIKLSFGDISKIGLSTLPILVGTLAVCFIGGHYIGRALNIEKNTRTLITVGTGICGASAIATIAPIIGATAAQVAYAMSTIFLFNIAAVILFPILGHMLNMSDFDFGLFAGTAVNDTSSVVAAAATFSLVAMNYAVVVKLVRTLAIVPVALVLGAQNAQPDDLPWYRKIPQYIPWFLVGFLILVVFNSLVPIQAQVVDTVTFISTSLITLALAAIGLSTDVLAFKVAGFKPVILGLILWILVMGSSLLLQWIF